MDSEYIQNEYGLTPDELSAVQDAYTTFRNSTAPFMVSIAADMLDDLKEDVRTKGEDHRVAFLGRDGTSLSLAVRELDPEFHDRYCADVTLSRAVAEAALQDRETNEGRSFPDIETFRGARNKVGPESIDFAHQQTQRMFQRSGVPMGEPNSSVTLVDTSFKGTVQELLTEAYPETELTGRYAFLSKTPDDPRPEAKLGYVFHQEAGEKWKGFPSRSLSEDPAETFGNQDALGTIEETLHGPLDSPRGIGPEGPVQRPQREQTDPTEGINPNLVSEVYKSPRVREAVKVVALDAVADAARDSARKRDSGQDWRAELSEARRSYTSETRAWVAGRPTQDAHLTPLFDSFVRRADKGLVKDLSRSLEGRDLSPEAHHRTWDAFGRAGTLESKKAYVDNVGAALAKGGRNTAGQSSEAASTTGNATSDSASRAAPSFLQRSKTRGDQHGRGTGPSKK
ncbi:ABC transporter permease [Nocardiopsis sp. HNM0947]|uniref:ABC transporter permease n=1 Tax=Nocardiopsis coralli TaxID=2772213 RepID=A0ABR9P2A5_9ACTN|nr:ABC transporter permease [Nocardiopsis coralli]MBE2997958.1 ABC transporter permease [Nocardiopsis coralli]